MLYFSQTVFKIIIFTAAGIIFMLQPAGVLGAQSYEIGVVTVNKLNVRAKPGIMNAPLKLIEKGTKVRILEHLDGWLKIRHQDQVGYIRNLKRYVRIISIDQTTKKKKTRGNDGDVKRFKKEAEDINRKIEKGRAKVLTFTREEASIVSSLNDIDLALNQAVKRSSALKFELTALGKKITETTKASKDLKKKIEAGEDYMFKRLVALYKLNWLGRIYVLVSTQSMYDLFKRKKSLETILAYDEKILQNLLDNKAKFQQLLVRLNSQKMEKLSIEADLKNQIAAMSHERTKRSGLLAKIRSKKSLELAAIESLKQAAKDLDEKIKNWGIGSNTGVSDAYRTGESFRSYKGLLKLPVKGKIVSLFGKFKNTHYQVLNFRSGIEIETDRGEPIQAVYAGKVLYADWFKGYGNMIIIDHGDNYYTVYAHIEETFKTAGDLVETGEVVATVGDTGSITGSKLYFEVRHHGKPLDPMQWLEIS